MALLCTEERYPLIAPYCTQTQVHTGHMRTPAFVTHSPDTQSDFTGFWWLFCPSSLLSGFFIHFLIPALLFHPNNS